MPTEEEMGLVFSLADARSARQDELIATLNRRLANNLTVIAGLLGAQPAPANDAAGRETLADVAARFKAIARVHRHLQEQAKLYAVDIDAFLGAICREACEAVDLEYDLKAEPIEVPTKVAMHMALIVNELLINARKHAYANTSGGVVNVACARDAEGALVLTVADHGAGLPEGFDLDTCSSFGMSIARTLSQQIGAVLSAESHGRGARFVLRAPLSREG
jgi:two-component sensor histidine kinase